MKIWFADFWPNFDGTYFKRVLELALNKKVTIDPNPDILFYSVFGQSYRGYKCKKILYTGETRKNDGFNLSLSFDGNSDNNIRLPLWVLYIDWFGQGYDPSKNPAYLINPNDLLSRNFSEKKKFCNFIYNNNSGPRVEFLEKISKYKSVDCLGSLCNNSYVLGGDEKSKIDVQKDYKFTIAFENTYYQGYVTEKILHPFGANSLPIYWGSDSVMDDFNKGAFIYVNSYRNFETAIEYIEFLDKNDNEYMKMVTQSCFNNNKINECFMPHNIGRSILEKI